MGLGKTRKTGWGGEKWVPIRMGLGEDGRGYFGAPLLRQSGWGEKGQPKWTKKRRNLTQTTCSRSRAQENDRRGDTAFHGSREQGNASRLSRTSSLRESNQGGIVKSKKRLTKS